MIVNRELTRHLSALRSTFTWNEIDLGNLKLTWVIGGRHRETWYINWHHLTFHARCVYWCSSFSTLRKKSTSQTSILSSYHKLALSPTTTPRVSTNIHIVLFVHKHWVAFLSKFSPWMLFIIWWCNWFWHGVMDYARPVSKPNGYWYWSIGSIQVVSNCCDEFIEKSLDQYNEICERLNLSR